MSEISNTDLLIAITRLEEKLTPVIEKTVDHEARLRLLERARWPLPSIGAVTGIAGVATGLLALFH